MEEHLLMSDAAGDPNPITTHVLDTSCGSPARGLGVLLEILEANGTWTELNRTETTADGRVSGRFLPRALEARIYRVTFDTKRYFEAKGQVCFYPEVKIMFEIVSIVEHYHVPLILSPFGYSTYRGS